MRNTLFIIGLCSFVISCESQKKIKKNSINPKTTSTTPTIATEKPKVKSEEGDYYRVNISDPTKNDNTISYGSIVSANPKNFKITKTHFPAVAQNFRQKYIILHYTALNDEKSISVLTQQSVSSHYLINSYDDNEIYQLVDENKRAYHAGISNWRKDQNLNDTSIGIEIVNGGYTIDSTGNKAFPIFPEEQVKKIGELVKDIATRYKIPATNILAHSDIAPTRKSDPGPQFPWKKLYTDYQIGMWYDDATRDLYINQMPVTDFALQYNTPAFIIKVQAALNKLGYLTPISSTWDKATKQTIEALQYHFRPQLSNGVLDVETWAILQALNDKYPS